MENEELSSSPAPVASAAPAPAQTPAPAPQFDPRRRIRELLSIPERDRTDAEWDELNELEIQTAPGNRLGNQQPSGYAAKPAGFNPKNRPKGKGKPGGGGGGGRPQGRPQHPNNNKPRPA